MLDKSIYHFRGVYFVTFTLFLFENPVSKHSLEEDSLETLSHIFSEKQRKSIYEYRLLQS